MLSIRFEPCRSLSTQPDTKAQTGAKPWIVILAVVLRAFSADCECLYHLNEKLFWFDEEVTALLVAPRNNMSVSGSEDG
jgi:hypothetical protein